MIHPHALCMLSLASSVYVPAITKMRQLKLDAGHLQPDQQALTPPSPTTLSAGMQHDSASTRSTLHTHCCTSPQYWAGITSVDSVAAPAGELVVGSPQLLQGQLPLLTLTPQLVSLALSLAQALGGLMGLSCTVFSLQGSTVHLNPAPLFSRYAVCPLPPTGQPTNQHNTTFQREASQAWSVLSTCAV